MTRKYVWEEKEGCMTVFRHAKQGALARSHGGQTALKLNSPTWDRKAGATLVYSMGKHWMLISRVTAHSLGVLKTCLCFGNTWDHQSRMWVSRTLNLVFQMNHVCLWNQYLFVLPVEWAGIVRSLHFHDMKVTNRKMTEMAFRAWRPCLLASREAGPYQQFHPVCLLRLVGLGVLGKSRQLTPKMPAGHMLCLSELCKPQWPLAVLPACKACLGLVFMWGLLRAMSAHTCHYSPWLSSPGAVIVLLDPVCSFYLPLLYLSIFTVGEFFKNSLLQFCP